MRHSGCRHRKRISAPQLRGVSRETLLRKKYFAAKAEMVAFGVKLTPSRQCAIQFMSTRPSSELLQGMEALGQRD